MSGSLLLTGASSFVGCHLATAFAAAGWRVTAVHSRPLGAYDDIRRQRLDFVAQHAALLEADLRDPSTVRRLAARVAPSLWIQHAGFADDYGSLDYKLDAAHAVNVMALKPIYAALANGECGVVVTGSSMEYAASEQANREEDACWPDTPYGLSKLSETLLARQLAFRHGVKTRVARLYIPFGKYDNPKKLLPAVAAALSQSRPIDLSACQQKRDLVSVEDIAGGYLKLAADLSRTAFDVFNLCRGEAVRLKDFLVQLAEQSGADPSLLRFGKLPLRAGETEVSFGSADKARRLLGWQARPLTTGLGEVF